MIRFSNISKEFILQKSFLGAPRKTNFALNNISFDAPIGQSTGIVGESGSGKSTLIRIFMGLYRPSSGYFAFNELLSPYMNQSDWKKLRSKAAMVFQDPWGSLNPRLKISKILAEPLAIHGKSMEIHKRDWKAKIEETLFSVGLSAEAMDKYPHEFSGGQRQRVGIARALILRPQVILLDEPVSALDVSIQAQILNLLYDLKNQFNLTYLFIAHDLAVVRYLCNSIVVLYSGRIMEIADTQTLFTSPKHPYTQMLLDSMPEVGKPLAPTKYTKTIQNKPLPVQAEVPLEHRNACPFLVRCHKKIKACYEQFPEQTHYSKGSYFCHNPL